MRSLVAAAERGIWSPEEQRWRDRIWAEVANLRAAVEWSLEGEDPNLGAAILVDLWYVWVTAEHHPELLAWTATFTAQLGHAIADLLWIAPWLELPGLHAADDVLARLDEPLTLRAAAALEFTLVPAAE